MFLSLTTVSDFGYRKSIKLAEVPVSQKIMNLTPDAMASFSNFLAAKSPSLQPLLKMLDTIVNFFNFTSSAAVRHNIYFIFNSLFWV